MKGQNTAAILRQQILAALKDHSRCSLTAKQLLQALDLQPADRAVLQAELERLVEEGLVFRVERRRYGLPRRHGCLTGVLQGHRRGFAFLRPDEKTEDVFISPGKMKDAVHGDRVMVRLAPGGKRRRREGEVITVLSRGASRLVGTLEQHGKHFFVLPDDQRFGRSIRVSGALQQARRGDKVVVEICHRPAGHRPILGRVVERLGPAGSARAEELSFYRKFQIPGDFPPPVMAELESLPGEGEIIRVAEREGRADLTGLPMVTIDDESARDYDDAVSLEETAEGTYRLGVHIADVSHYVREGRALDREARTRATSVYLVDRVIHMLPPLLSEELCSLRAGRERLAFSVFMDLTAEGELTGYDFSPSLIRVTERLTYRRVERFLAGEQGEKPLQHEFLGPMLRGMDRLAARLKERRLQRGALDLDMPEARIVLDGKGTPLSVERRRMGRAESLIEEFMILCNEVVASYMERKKLPCLYRVHGVPTAEKLAYLRQTLALMGFDPLSGIKELKPGHLNMLLERSKGQPAERLVRYLLLRSLPQARYSAANGGHFGLASRCYCHFTSPIRRYPDLVVHRILKEHLAGTLKPERLRRLQARLPDVALHASERERAAMEAERADQEIKKAEYMAGKLGEIYPGVISGVTNFGLFVELENTVEGMIPVGDLTDDDYVYQEKQAALVGERTRKRFRLGDPIEVQVVRVDRREGNITFVPA